ncbi:hypothetical protein Aduo_019348 [Ancylostoma duodenale]
MERGASQSSPNNLVSRILQVALGLFVTTSDLPPYPANHEYLSYDCSFDSDCRWASVGGTMDHWRIARGEPDSLLWLAATGTMQLPREPFVLIEQRGNPVDALMTDEIRCQKGSADLSFIYWAIGSADLEICLTDVNGERFNCTGMLGSSVMPGKVFLKIPEIQKPFRVMISSNNLPGVLIIDDIRYDASTCRRGTPPIPPPAPGVRGRGIDIYGSTTIPPKIIPWTRKVTTTTTTAAPTTSKVTTTSTTEATTVTLPPTTEELPTEEVTVDLPNPTSSENSIIERKTPPPLPTPSTEVPFELMVLGNKSKPLFDRRTGTVITEAAKLLCDFNNEFACQWGAEAGRWAVIEKGVDSQLVECIDQGASTRHESRLAVFDLTKTIKEPFTLNLVPHWEKGVKNRFLVIDEIAYIGECAQPGRKQLPETSPATTPLPSTTTEPAVVTTTTEEVPVTEAETAPPTRGSGVRKTIWPKPRVITLPTVHVVKPATKDPYPKKKPYPTRIISTTRAPDYPRTTRWTTTQKTPYRWVTPTLPTTEEPSNENYCDSLNCNFDDNACSYLNHGLTKKPWTLRNRGYGYPLTGGTDVRPTATNGQFVSTILDPGDIAILESPKMNATRSLNVLLFQYFRPSQMTTIRLCLGSRYTNPFRSVAAFTRCPSILRSVTSKNAYRWNTVHVQLPPGTTHFFLVAHNSERADSRAAVALDNMRVAICDPRGFAPDYLDEVGEQQHFVDYDHGGI